MADTGLTATVISEKLAADFQAVKEKQDISAIRAKIQALSWDITRVAGELSTVDTKALDADIAKPLSAAIGIINTASEGFKEVGIAEYLSWKPAEEK
jgi:hypothetical protein